MFISYSRTDRAYVDNLVVHLEAHQIPVWIDHDIDYGDRWDTVIREQVDACGVFMPVMSPASDDSSWVSREVLRAEAKQKPMVPLLLKGDAFFRLADVHWVDVRDGRMPGPDVVSRLRSLLGVSAVEDGKDPESRTPKSYLAAYPYHFAGTDYWEMRELLTTFGDAWDPACKELQRDAFREWVIALDPRMPKNLLDCPSEEGIVRLNARFARDRPPIFGGRRVDAAGLAKLFAEADAGDADSNKLVTKVVGSVRLAGYLTRHRCTSGHPQCVASDSCEVMAQVAAEIARAAENTFPPFVTGEDLPSFLRCLVDPHYIDQLRQSLATLNSENLLGQQWQVLAEQVAQSDAAGLAALVAAVTSGEANRRTLVAHDEDVAASGRATGVGAVGVVVLTMLTYWIITLESDMGDLWLGFGYWAWLLAVVASGLGALIALLVLIGGVGFSLLAAGGRRRFLHGISRAADGPRRTVERDRPQTPGKGTSSSERRQTS